MLPESADSDSQPKLVPVQLELSDYKNYCGLDPGRRDMFVAINQSDQKIKCSSRQFYSEAKCIVKFVDGKIQMREISEAFRNMPAKKTGSLEGLKTYVKFVLARLHNLIEWNMQMKLGHLKFKRYIYVQKKIDELCNQFSGSVVGFGDWSANDSGGFIKKCPGGPMKRLEEEFYQRILPCRCFRM